MKALTPRQPRTARRGPTIYEVASHAGVSIATVSRVQRGGAAVAPPTRDRVERAIEELAYRPSAAGRSLAAGQHDAVGIVFPDLSGPYYSAVVLGYEEAAASASRSALILATHGRPRAADQVIDLAHRVDGLVILGRTVDDGVVSEIDRRGTPIVLLARPAVGDADTVRTDNRAPAERLAMHLLEHGRRRLVFLGDPEGSPDVSERFEGFVAAHRAMGVEVRPPRRCAYREADGRQATLDILARGDRPDAIVAANDEIAIGALDAASRAGLRVPDDLAITGWDDIAMARHVAPGLTTVRQPMHGLGRRAAQLLAERIATHRSEPRHETLPTELVVRSSCGCRAAHPREGGDS